MYYSVEFTNGNTTTVRQFAKFEFAAAFARRFGSVKTIDGKPRFVPGIIRDQHGTIIRDTGI